MYCTYKEPLVVHVDLLPLHLAQERHHLLPQALLLARGDDALVHLLVGLEALGRADLTS